jgi:hypothetical protein
MAFNDLLSAAMINKTGLKKIFKWLGILLLAFFVFVAIAISIAYMKRDEIKQRIVDGFSERVNGSISVKKIHFTVFHHFPDLSISLQDVVLQDTLNEQPVLSSKKIYLDIGFYALFRNQINMTELFVEKSSVFLYRGKNGYSNTSVFKPKADSAAGADSRDQGYAVQINGIAFRDLNFVYIDSLKNKRIIFQLVDTYHRFFGSKDSLEMIMTGKAHCNELTFNDRAGGFLQDKSFTTNLQILYNKAKAQLLILPSTIHLDEDQIDVKGEFLLDQRGLFSLDIDCHNLMLSRGQSYVNNQIRATLEKFSIDKAVDVHVRIYGKHNESREPKADVTFHTQDADFEFGKLRLQELTCTGQYLHRPDSLSKENDRSSVQVESFHAATEGIGFDGTLTLTKLLDPVMDLSVKSRITADIFNKLVDTTEWVSRSGIFFSSAKYFGRLEEYLDATTSKYHGQLSGNFRARNGTFIYKPRNMILQDINASFHFNENQFTIDTLNLALNGSPLRVKGSMTNYIPFFIQPANKGYVKLDLISPRLDLSFIASEKREIKKSRKQEQVERKRITNILNILQRKLQFDIAVYAADFTFKKFNAQKIKGKVKLDGNILEIPNIEMNVAKGTMATRLLFTTDSQSRRFVSVKTDIIGADIREFFKMFNDFNQKTISAENLAGNIYAQASFSAQVLRNYDIDPASMKGNVSCTVRKGQLINFEPLQNVSNFLFKKRDFADVHFAQLESDFQINGTDIDIDGMEVQSSVLSFFLEGRYSFKDSTSLSLQLPLNNLKKRDKNFKPDNTRADPKRGLSVYLHIFRNKDINSEINIAYDPFKKWVKKGD